jgi:hypothetical protein
MAAATADAAAKAAAVTFGTGKRLRRMTPLEMTRFLPGRVIEDPPAPGEARPSYVIVKVGEGADDLPAVVPPVSIDDPVLRRNRWRCMAVAGAYDLERWLAARDVPFALFDLLPAFQEAVATVALGAADEYDRLLETFWAGGLADEWAAPPEPSPFTTLCEELEAVGADHPADDLPTVNEIDVEVALYELTGAYGLDLTDDEMVDALNAVEAAPGRPVTALTDYLARIGKGSQWPRE